MYSVRQLVTEIKADFAARGVTADVVFGTWNVGVHAGANRVVIGLGAVELNYTGSKSIDKNPAGFGMRVLPGNTQAASALAMHIQNLKIWCHGIADEGTALEDIPALNHDRTVELMHATVAALYRCCGGSASLGLGAGEWPQEEPGDVTYGSLVTFECGLAVPVLNDKWAVVKPDSMTMTLKADLPSGLVTVAQVTVPTSP